jgi:hypothetical protein
LSFRESHHVAGGRWDSLRSTHSTHFGDCAAYALAMAEAAPLLCGPQSSPLRQRNDVARGRLSADTIINS